MALILKQENEENLAATAAGKLSLFVSSSGELSSNYTTLKGNKGRTLHDTTHSPVGLWQLNGDGLDDSGNGVNLFESGSADYGVGHARLSFEQSSTNYWTSADASLHLTGAMSAYALISTPQYSSTQVVLIWQAPGETEAANVQYAIRIVSGQINYLHEYGAGSNELLSTVGLVLPTDEWFWVGITRDSAGTGVKIFLNGGVVAVGTLGNAPTGGSTAQLIIGQDAGEVDPFTGRIQSVKIVDSELTEAEMLAEYERVFGIS